MTSALLASVTRGSGGGLIMPDLITNANSLIKIKNGLTTDLAVNNAAFWAVMDASHTDQGYETVKLAASNGVTAKQTIVDTASSGVLTQVIGPTLNGTGVVTFYVTIDGSETVFTSPLLPNTNASRYSIGLFLGWGSETQTGEAVGYGSANDGGFDDSQSTVMLLTPKQSLSYGGVGMVFKTSLKVEFDISDGTATGVSTTPEQNKCLASYSTTIPEGL